MGTRPGLRSIPHISGILLLMQLLLLQPLVDAKAETSAAVDPRSVPASPAKMTDFKQEGDANGFRVFITFEGNPHYRGIEELVKVSTNGWNETFSEPRDNTTKFKRTFEFVIPEEFKFHQFAIIFGKEVHIFQLEATGFEKNAVYQKYIGLVNYLSEKVKYMMPDYGVGWMSQVVRKELDNIIYTQTNLSDHLRQLKTDIESIKAKLPESFDGFITIDALNKLQEITGFSLRTAISPYRHIKYIFVEKNMDRDTAEAACTLLDGTLATPSTYDEFDFLDSHMERFGYYHLGAQCKDCTFAGDDKWEWSTGEPLSLRFRKWGSFHLRFGIKSGRKYPYGNEDDIYLFAIKPSLHTWKPSQAYIVNFNGKFSGHAICQENIA